MKIGITYNLKAAHVDDDSQEEFDSPVTIDAIASVIGGLGHDVVKLGDGKELLEKLLAEPPEFVFNFAEGHGISRSREARVPAVLEMLGIPYTGSDPLTLAVTLDKDCAKRLVASAGVAVPKSHVIHPGERDWKIAFPFASFPFPAIVKPNWEGSSKGIRQKSLVKTPDELPEVVAWLRGEQRQPVLVEEYIQGDELTVGMLGNDDTTGAIPEARRLASGLESSSKPRGESSSPAGLHILGVLRVLPLKPAEHFIYSLEIKREYKKLVRYEVPARITATDLAAVEQAARTVWRVLGCRDVSRVDFRLRDGVPYFLEVNPLPGLNPEDSDLVIMSRIVGWTYEKLVATILHAGLNRQQWVMVSSLAYAARVAPARYP
jgi:D-alanine-D-alanine ligase